MGNFISREGWRRSGFRGELNLLLQENRGNCLSKVKSKFLYLVFKPFMFALTIVLVTRYLGSGALIWKLFLTSVTLHRL